MPRNARRTPAPLAALLTLLSAATFGRAAAPADPIAPDHDRNAPAIAVRVDPRVELVGIVFRLAGHPEYNRARFRAYAESVEAHFGKWRDHPVVRRARELRRTRGVTYDACMSLAIHLTDAETLGERVPFDPRPEALDDRWTPQDARAFLADLRDFAAKSRFADFFAAQRETYAAIEARMRALIDRDAHPEWFPAFFGDRPGARFAVFIAPLNGPNCYGTRARLPDGTEELHAIIGTWLSDGHGLPEFDRTASETIVHEFTHSYANAIIDQHEPELRGAGEALFATVAPAMRRQAYGEWTIMLKESLVRACTLRHIRRFQGSAAARRATQEELQRQFLWIAELDELLGEYERDRDRYPTLASFAPRLVAFFDEQARRRSSAAPGPSDQP